MKRSFKTLVAAAATALMTSGALAAEPRKVVPQISDDGAERQMLVLNVASNLQKAYGEGNAPIEVVACGPGLTPLLKDNSNADRIQGLTMEGVRFSACENTIKGLAKKLGHAPEINPNAVKAAVGVGRMLELTEQGYTLVRP